MRVVITGEDRSLAIFDIGDDGAVRLRTGDGSDELEAVRALAETISFGPPPWLGPIQTLQQWAEREGLEIDLIDVPELPELPEDATP